METRRMTPFFYPLFSIEMSVTFIFEFENTQNAFSCGSPLVHSGLKNTSIFGQKLPIRIAHHNFPENRHPEVATNLYYVSSTRRNQTPIF